MADPRDPHAAERRAERVQAYADAMDEYRANAYMDPDPEVRAWAIINCQLCDDDGYRNQRVCDHVDRTQTARQGIAKCREALAAKQLRLDQDADQ